MRNLWKNSLLHDNSTEVRVAETLRVAVLEGASEDLLGVRDATLHACNRNRSWCSA